MVTAIYVWSIDGQSSNFIFYIIERVVRLTNIILGHPIRPSINDSAPFDELTTSFAELFTVF